MKRISLKAKFAGTMVAVAALGAAAFSLAMAGIQTADWRWLLLPIVALGLGLWLFRGVVTPIEKSVEALTMALRAVANGQREVRVPIATGDELETLGNTFNQALDGLDGWCSQLERQAHAMEQKVEERTKELGQRNREMRLILDRVQQGFLTVSANGVLLVERSTVIDRWFGPFGAGIPYVDYMNQLDPVYAASFGLGFEAILDDCLPLDLCIDQLPTCLRKDGREYRCRYSPLLRGEHFDGLLVVIDDVTNELLYARQEAERREVLALIGMLTKDRAGFVAFLDEVKESLDQVATVDRETQERILHALESNAAKVGLSMVAGLCRQLAGQLGERSALLPGESFAPLLERWQKLETSLHTFLGSQDAPLRRGLLS